MLRPLSPYVLILGLFVILGINGIAYWKHLYFFVWWLDIPVHFISGAWLAMAILGIVASHPRLSGVRRDPFIAFVFTVGVVMIIGVLWELFEFRIDTLVRFAPHDLEDTLSDLLFDFLGGIIGSIGVLVLRYTDRDV